MPFPYVFPFYFEADPLEYAVTVVVRMAFGDDMFEAAPTWTTLTGTDVLEVHTQRGRQHELARMEAGTCTIILDNASGDYYPDNAGGAYFPDIKTMVRVNVRAYYGGSGGVVDVFTGYVESWTPSWLGKSGKGPLVKVVCSDALKVFARALMNNAGEAVELSSVRLGNIGDEVGWPAGWRDFDAGQLTVQATGAQANVNALEQTHKLQESELSLIYIAPDNDLQFENRSHRTIAPHDAAEMVFGDDGEGAGEDRYEGVTFVLDEALLYNDVRMTRTGGAEQTSSNAASQTAYGIRSLARSGLLQNADVDAGLLSDYLVARHAEVAIRAKTITIRPGKNPGSLWYKVLNFDISTRMTVRLDQASIDKDYYIEGIAHDWISKTENFTTRWQLSDADQDFNTPDAKTEILRPNAAGDLTQNAFVGGASNWQSVDEVVADGDATYVEPGGGGQRTDLYNVDASVYQAGVISSVEVFATIRWDLLHTPSQTSIKLKAGGTTGSGATFVPTVAWVEYSEVFTVSPDTGVAFTWAEIAALQIGVTLWRDGGTPFERTRCTQVYCVIDFTPSW